MESIASWVAPVATTLAALMTASNLGSRVTGWGFGVFLIGSIAWMILGLASDQPNLVWQNVILSLLNLLGMWRWLGRQARIEDGAEAASARSEALPSETLFPASLLTRAAVVGPGGEALGKAVDAMVGATSGRLSYVVVGEGGVAGVGERYRRVDWRQLAVADEALRCAEPKLDTMPQVERDNWPAR